jgi:hypothetical protein
MTTGAFLICCADCGMDLGRLTGHANQQGRTKCPHCGWWCTWQFVFDATYPFPVFDLLTMSAPPDWLARMVEKNNAIRPEA